MADREKTISEEIRHHWEHGDEHCVKLLLALRNTDSVEDAIREETLEKLFDEDIKG